MSLRLLSARWRGARPCGPGYLFAFRQSIRRLTPMGQRSFSNTGVELCPAVRHSAHMGSTFRPVGDALGLWAWRGFFLSASAVVPPLGVVYKVRSSSASVPSRRAWPLWVGSAPIVILWRCALPPLKSGAAHTWSCARPSSRLGLFSLSFPVVSSSFRLRAWPFWVESFRASIIWRRVSVGSVSSRLCLIPPG